MCSAKAVNARETERHGGLSTLASLHTPRMWIGFFYTEIERAVLFSARVERIARATRADAALPRRNDNDYLRAGVSLSFSLKPLKKGT